MPDLSALSLDLEQFVALDFVYEYIQFTATIQKRKYNFPSTSE